MQQPRKKRSLNNHLHQKSGGLNKTKELLSQIKPPELSEEQYKKTTNYNTQRKEKQNIQRTQIGKKNIQVWEQDKLTVRHFDKKKDDNQNKSLNVEITTSTQVDNKELKDIKKQNKKTKQKEKKTESLVINIISNNINGLKVQSSPYLLESIFRKMYDIDIDILLLQETNTNMKNPKSKRVLQSATQQYQSIQLQYADFQEEENKAERYCWEDIAANLKDLTLKLFREAK